MKKIIVLLLALAFSIQVAAIPSLHVSAEENKTTDFTVLELIGEESNFFNYYIKHHNDVVPEDIFTVFSKDIQCAHTSIDSEVAISIDEGNKIEFQIDVESSGIYPVSFRYYNTDESDSNYIVSLKLNGQSPYDEANNFSLPRLWKDDVDDEFKKDDYGNDIRPSQTNVIGWTKNYIYDSRGFYKLPYFLYLEKGLNNIELTAVTNDLILSEVSFGMNISTIDYKTYSESFVYSKNENIYHQAEKI